MTQSERRRFTILVIILLVLGGIAVYLNRFRPRTELGADTLGEIQNQAVATFNDGEGNNQTTLSDISKVRVTSGSSDLSMIYKLQGTDKQQNATFAIQLFKPNSDTPLTTVPSKRGEAGRVTTTLKNIPNGTYDFAAKPVGFLAQAVLNYPFVNGQATQIEFKEPFPWGDINRPPANPDQVGDGIVNSADWSELVNKWQQQSDLADFNGDGVVNSADASVMLNNWMKTDQRFVAAQRRAAATPVPED